MTCNPETYEEAIEGALKKMPFDVAHSFARLGYYEAWRTALVRAEKARNGKGPIFEGFDSALELHKKRAKEARETWTLLGGTWAKVPRGEKDGGEVVKAVLDLAKAAAEHCGACRVFSGLALKGKKEEEKQRAEADEPYRKFEAAKEVLKEHNGVLTKDLRNSIVDTLWAAGWQAANAVGDMLGELEMEQDEEEHDDADEEDEEGCSDEEDEDKDDSEDEDERFGENYPGSSDDAVEDLGELLASLRECFWEQKLWRGVRLDISSFGAAQAVAELEAIAAVPGAFGEKGLNAVRLVLKDIAGAKDPLGEALRAALLKAQALEIQVILEPSFEEAGKKHETWLKALATAAAPSSCVRGVALPLSDAATTAGFVAAVRNGGLSQERCVIILPVPCGRAQDGEGEWTPGFAAMHQNHPPAGLPALLQDGNAILEVPPKFPSPDEDGPTDLQSLLDYCPAFCPNFGYVGVAASLTLNIPDQTKAAEKKASKTKAAETAAPSDAWFAEYAQRLLASAVEASHGFFFDSWLSPEGGAGLKDYIEKSWVNLAAEEQIMQPVGGTHKATLVYLHGFTADGNSYLNEPYHFYRPKSQKKKAAKGLKKSKDEGDDEDDLEFEPYPGLKIVLPTAPVRKITAHAGDENRAWHDYITDHDGEFEDELSMEDLEEQTRRIHAILDREVALVGARNVFFGGASQGCGMSMHAGLTYPGDLGAMIGTMGHVLTGTPVTPEWVARKVPVYNYIGDADTTMPWEKWVKATWQRLEDAGAEVYTHIEPGVDHAEHEEHWTRAFLKERMTPSSVKRTAAKKPAKKK